MTVKRRSRTKKEKAQLKRKMNALLKNMQKNEHDNIASWGDEINHPPHYTSHPSGVECIEIIEHFSFNIGNATKYLWRSGLKSSDSRKDLEKAIWYIKRELERLATLEAVGVKSRRTAGPVAPKAR